jgi:hypothetical protein
VVDGGGEGFLEPSNSGRVVAYGYRSSEIRPLADMDLPVSPEVKFRQWSSSDTAMRKPVQTSLGCHVRGMALPHVDPGDTKTALDGAKKRMASWMPPEMDQNLAEEFTAFVDQWISENLTPLPSDSDCSVEKWLETTHYPQWRKEQLLKKNLGIVNENDLKHLFVKCFIKDETYTEYKHARGIYSRTDEFKTMVGPIFRLIEKQLFAKDCFIKKIPVNERPQYILDYLRRDGCEYLATDFTSYEAHFRKLMDYCEFRLYEYMTKDLPKGKWFMDLLRRSVGSTNRCIFKWFDFTVWRRRMSGEMCTSLGNGFTNLMLLKFLFKKTPNSVLIAALVEGDDGLTAFQGDRPSAELISSLGLRLKLEYVTDVNLASFCGQIFDVDEKMVVTNPMEVIASFGWTTARYLKSSDKRLKQLLRSKALSYLYQYPGCPIVASLAKYGLRMTREVRARGPVTNEYEREEFEIMVKAMAKYDFTSYTVGPKTRKLVALLYNIPEEIQTRIEQYLDGLTSLQPLNCPEIYHCGQKVWSHYYDNYVSKIELYWQSESLFPHFVVISGATAALQGIG